MQHLPQLRYPQSEFLLLRSCMGITKLFSGLRTCQPNHMEKETIWFDKEFLREVEEIMVGEGHFFWDL